MDFAARRAILSDAVGIFSLIQQNREELVPRSMGNIIENIDRFRVVEDAGRIVGCAAYQIHPEIGDPTAAAVEIQSVAVDAGLRGCGIGRELVESVMDSVKVFVPREVLVLTFAPEFFRKLGFVEIPKTKVMHKLYTGCINCTKHANPFTCPEIAMTRTLG